jgi:hypothetical protein
MQSGSSQAQTSSGLNTILKTNGFCLSLSRLSHIMRFSLSN